MDELTLSVIDFLKNFALDFLSVYLFSLVVTVLLRRFVLFLADGLKLIEYGNLAINLAILLLQALVFSFGMVCLIVRIIMTFSFMLIITHGLLHIPEDPSIVISLVVAFVANICLIICIKIRQDKKEEEEIEKAREKKAGEKTVLSVKRLDEVLPKK